MLAAVNATPIARFVRIIVVALFAATVVVTKYPAANAGPAF